MATDGFLTATTTTTTPTPTGSRRNSVSNNRPRNGNIVIFSGGSAANSLVDVFESLRAANGKDTTLSYVVPISDNGGSSSELIRVFGGPGKSSSPIFCNVTQCSCTVATAVVPSTRCLRTLRMRCAKWQYVTNRYRRYPLSSRTSHPRLSQSRQRDYGSTSRSAHRIGDRNGCHQDILQPPTRTYLCPSSRGMARYPRNTACALARDLES